MSGFGGAAPRPVAAQEDFPCKRQGSPTISRYWRIPRHKSPSKCVPGSRRIVRDPGSDMNWALISAKARKRYFAVSRSWAGGTGVVLGTDGSLPLTTAEAANPKEIVENVAIAGHQNANRRTSDRRTYVQADIDARPKYIVLPAGTDPERPVQKVIRLPKAFSAFRSIKMIAWLWWEYRNTTLHG